MKKTFNNLWVILPIVFGSVLISVTATLVFMSDILQDTKYSFTVLLFGGGGALLTIYFSHLLKTEYNHGIAESEQKWNNAYQTLGTEKEKVIGEKNKEIEELKKKLATVPAVNPALDSMDNNTLAQKRSYLENLRKSFPYRISEQYRLFAVMKTEVQVSHYSRWQIVGEFENQLFSLDVIRPDKQSYKEMLQLASSTKTPQEIAGFSLHNDVWWD